MYGTGQNGQEDKTDSKYRTQQAGLKLQSLVDIILDTPYPTTKLVGLCRTVSELFIRMLHLASLPGPCQVRMGCGRHSAAEQLRIAEGCG